ncbi:MAG: hypothetical protein Tsb009_32690 [Planctomycetaceae bacterium]
MQADEQPKNGEPFGQRIVLSGAVTPVFERDLMSLAKNCQSKAIEENRESVLVVEIHRGPSKFGRVLDIAKFLISQEISRVRTVAWIPKGQTVTGNNVIIALACRDLIMHPDAVIGDIGDGKAADEETVEPFVKSLVENRHNPRLHWAVVKGMLNPDTIVKKIKIRHKAGENLVTEFVTETRLQELRAQNAEIPEEPVIFKDGGEPGQYSGSKAHIEGTLVTATRKSLDELAAIYNVPAKLLHAVPVATGKDKKVALIRVTGEINPMLDSFLQRQIDRCLADGKNMIIFEITSPGGYLISGERLSNRIMNLDPKKVKTIAYIPRQALSAAAIIALACDEIYIHSDALIGDAGPISVRKGGQFERAEEKILSYLKGIMRILAKKKHRPPALLEAMADRNMVVYRVQNRDAPDRISYMTDTEIEASNGMWIKGPVVPESEKGDLLTLTGKRALELKLAEGVVEGTTDDEMLLSLKAHLGLPADMELIPLERTWIDTLVFLLNTKTATVLLLVVAIICIYLELQMTTGLLGIISALCFALFFWSRYLGGTAGWLEVILFILGLGCIAIEIFLIPGFGVFGISGGLMLLASLVMASQTFSSLEPTRGYRDLTETMGNLAISVVLVVVIAMALSRYLPHVPILNRLILVPPAGEELVPEEGPRLRPEHLDENLALVGRRGTAISVLRPAGKAEIDGEYVDVVSDGSYISSGSEVEVVQVVGNRIVVRAVNEHT